jgi:hypothetical protein
LNFVIADRGILSSISVYPLKAVSEARLTMALAINYQFLIAYPTLASSFYVFSPVT